MDTLDRLTRVAQEYNKGAIAYSELRGILAQIIAEDHNEILEAERNGTLVTLY